MENKEQQNDLNIVIDDEMRERINKTLSASAYDWFFNGNEKSQIKLTYNKEMNSFEFKF